MSRPDDPRPRVASPDADTMIETLPSGSAKRPDVILSTVARDDVDRRPAERDDDTVLPPRIGRFTPVRRVGAGAMGVVYSAYDELLDRRVAIKVLRGDRHGPDDPSRMLREAQALARLSHPNVVQIYDAGEHEGRLFVAMEFVRGRTLRAWLGEGEGGRGRQLRAIVDLFAQAGEGLAAAHAAGLTHRDFKPDNVLVGDDGRARVVDFGLAAAGERPPEADPEPPVAASVSVEITRTGTILGTPAYMPPEQLLGEPATARSDIFAFCVALHEAIHGARPFAGATVGELLLSIREGVPRDASGPAAPLWLRQVIERGLQADPDRRWPTMRALLEALARDPARRRRRVVALVAGALAIGALALGLGLREEARQRRCEARGAEIDAAWGAAARAGIEGAFAASGVVHAADTRARVIDRLDAWAGAWRRARTDLCAAEERGDRLARAEVTCLKGQLWRFRGLTDALGRADAGAVNRAVAAVSELPAVDRCEDLVWLRADAFADADADARAASSGAREALARARVRLSAGDLAGAEALVDGHLAGAGPPAIRAEALLLAGAIDRQRGELERAADRLDAAYYLAGEVAADLVAAEAALLSMATIGVTASRHDDGLRWGRSAAMLIRRLGLEEQELGGRYLVTLGAIERQRGDSDAALAAYERALAAFQRDLGPRHPSVARVLNNMGSALAEKHDFDGALARFREALAIFEEVHGPEHPDVGVFLANIGVILVEVGRTGEARAALERAAAVTAANLGEDHLEVAGIRSSLAGVAIDEQDFAGALVELERALAILRPRPASRELAFTEYNRGRALAGLGRADEALAGFTAALGLAESLAIPALIPRLRERLAGLRWERGERAEARALALAAREAYAADPAEGEATARMQRWLDDHPEG